MMNPILSSSVRRRMRGVRTPVIIALYDLLIAAFALLILDGVGAKALPMSRMRSGIDYYIMMLGVQFLLTVFPERGTVVEVKGDERAVLFGGTGKFKAETAGLGGQGADQTRQVQNGDALPAEDAV